jgi:hypothetical protein
MNVLVVGLILIVAYVVVMLWWLYWGEARFTFGREPGEREEEGSR